MVTIRVTISDMKNMSKSALHYLFLEFGSKSITMLHYVLWKLNNQKAKVSMHHLKPSESKRWQGFSSVTAKVKRGWEMCWSLLRSVLVYQTAAAPLMNDKQWAGAQSPPHLFFLSESWIYIMTWQAAQIIQLLPRPINTKLSALISALLHNEVMFAHT